MKTTTIWKYELAPSDNRFLIPEGAEFLELKTQNGIPCMWFMVDPLNKMVDRFF